MPEKLAGAGPGPAPFFAAAGGPGPVVRFTQAQREKKGEDVVVVASAHRHGDVDFSAFCVSAAASGAAAAFAAAGCCCGSPPLSVGLRCRPGSPTTGVMGAPPLLVLDGHNGTEAALYARDQMLGMVLEGLPCGEGISAWLQRLPAAMAEGFLKCHTGFFESGMTRQQLRRGRPQELSCASPPALTSRRCPAGGERSGTTATMTIVVGWVVTTAGVGDSAAILDTTGGGVTALTVDHRFDNNREECMRVKNEGGSIDRLKTFEGEEVGPLRSWPGGLCVSRSIGDMDCGSCITPLPHVKQVEPWQRLQKDCATLTAQRLAQVPKSGGRIIMASDGLWDAMKPERAAKAVRGKPSHAAAPLLVKVRPPLAAAPPSLRSARSLGQEAAAGPERGGPKHMALTLAVIAHEQAGGLEAIKARGLRDDVSVVVVDLLPSHTLGDDQDAAAVHKSLKTKKASFFSRLRSSRRRRDQEEPASQPMSHDDLPNLVNDHDSIKGGTLYQQYIKAGGSIHGAHGIFCSVCGVKISAETIGDVSIRAGNYYCEEHGGEVAEAPKNEGSRKPRRGLFFG
eukprot:SM000033S12362  [mRNA]  locus=s33:434401:436794:- [translate_table: standard]